MFLPVAYRFERVCLALRCVATVMVGSVVLWCGVVRAEDNLAVPQQQALARLVVLQQQLAAKENAAHKAEPFRFLQPLGNFQALAAQGEKVRKISVANTHAKLLLPPLRALTVAADEVLVGDAEVRRKLAHIKETYAFIVAQHQKMQQAVAHQQRLSVAQLRTLQLMDRQVDVVLRAYGRQMAQWRHIQQINTPTLLQAENSHSGRVVR